METLILWFNHLTWPKFNISGKVAPLDKTIMREERRGGTYNVCVVSNLHPVYRGVLFGIRFNC